MNANELADGLEIAKNKLIGKEHELGGRAIIFYTEAAAMLRQQQAEIEALKNWQDTWRPFLKQHFGIEK